MFNKQQFSVFLTIIIILSYHVLHGMESQEESKIGLIGKFLIDQKFKDIFSEEQLESLNPKINSEDLVLLGYNEEKNIYQLKPLQQYGPSCGAHAFKNCLWMLHGLCGNWDNFIQSYLKILDQNVFDNYFNSTTCRKQGSQRVLFSSQVEDIKNGKISCVLNNECLPEQSFNYLNRLFSFTYVRGLNNSWKYWFDFLKKTKEVLSHIEPHENIKLLARDVVVLTDMFSIADITNFYNLIKEENCSFAIDLMLDNGAMTHSAALVVNKKENEVEYLLFDSLNLQFDGGYPYMPLINSIKRFIENPEHLKNSLIRRSYIHVLTQLVENFDFPLAVFQSALSLFLYDESKSLNIVDNKLYQEVYKNRFCNLIKNHMKDDIENQEEYKIILHQMDC